MAMHYKSHPNYAQLVEATPSTLLPSYSVHYTKHYYKLKIINSFFSRNSVP